MHSPSCRGKFLVHFARWPYIEGKIIDIKEGPVSCEVTIETPAGEKIVSSITTTSAKSLGLAVGGKAYAVIKASNVMVAVD